MNPRPLSAIAALAFPVLAAAAPLQVQSSGLSVQVDDVTGNLLAVNDLATGSALLAAPGWLFMLHTPAGYLGSGNMPSPQVTRTAVGTRQSLLVSGTLTDGVGVTVSITADTGAPEIAFMLQVTNPSETIDELDCPLLPLVPQLGASQNDDQVFIPGGDGSVTRGAAIFNNWMLRDYPGYASMQVAAYFDDTVGLAIAARDATGEPKQIGAFATPGASVQLVMRHRAPVVAGAAVASYPVVIYPVHGSWMAAMAPYRAWARQQPFAAPRTGGQAAPAWVRARPITFEADLRPQGMGLRLVPLASWGTLMDEWRQALGPALMPLFRNFEHCGIYASPFYTPLYPSDAEVAGVLSDLKGRGHRSMAMVSGLKWLQSREQYPDAGNSPSYWVPGFSGQVDNGVDGGTVDGWLGPVWNGSSFDPPGAEVCTVLANGQVEVDPPSFTWDGTKGFMCPHHPFAKQVLVGLARHLAQDGLDLFELDQMNGGNTPPCFSTAHGHPPGYGPWMAADIASLMGAVLTEGRSWNPDFALSLEDPGELWLPYMDVMLCRPDNFIEWPATGDGSEVVPAFEFAYGDRTRCQTVDVQMNTGGVSSLEQFNEQDALLRMGRSLAAGALQCVSLSPWMLVAQYAPPPAGWPANPYNPFPPADALVPTPGRLASSEMTFLQHVIATQSGPALDALNDGLMAQPAPVLIPSFTYDEQVWNGTANVPTPRTRPAGALLALRQSDGGFAELLYDADMDAGFATTWPSTLDGVAISPTTPLTLYRNGIPESSGTFAQLTNVNLAPLDVVMLAPSPGGSDAGVGDGGTAGDAGGMPDSGSAGDAGLRGDGGTSADGGENGGTAKGCGCGASGATGMMATVWILAVLSLRRRRRGFRSPAGVQ